MRFSNRGRFLPRRALPSQRLASWEPRTGHARADGAQKGGASNSIQCPSFNVSPLVFPSLSSAFVLGALLLSPSLIIVRPRKGGWGAERGCVEQPSSKVKLTPTRRSAGCRRAGRAPGGAPTEGRAEREGR